MTEAEWLACSDPQKMLAYLCGKASDRSLRLFACACCRRMWHLLTDKRSQRAVEVAERFTDAQTDEDDLWLAGIDAENVTESIYAAASTAAQEAQVGAAFAAFSVTYTAKKAADLACSQAASAAFHAATAASAPSAAAARDGERGRQTRLLREIVGNPFRLVAVSPLWLCWNDATVVRLAQTAYDERILPAGTLDNTHLAILADALEEAGCTNKQILGHLRSGGEHYRGCFVVDALLDKM